MGYTGWRSDVIHEELALEQLAEWYRQYAPLVHARARRLLGDEADDVVQEVFVRLLDDRPKPDRLLPWMYTTSTNLCQNGIEIAHGATGHVEGNRVSGNEYTGSGAVSTGILVAGGPAFSPCAPPDGQCAYTTGTHIGGNSILDNDIGIYLLNLDAAFNPAPAPTRITVIGNLVSKSDGFTNGAYYQAGISDIGNEDVIAANIITGSGYRAPGIAIDADPAFTIRPKLRANVIR